MKEVKHIIYITGFILAISLALPALAAEGDSLWSRTYGGIDYEQASLVIETGDSGFLMAGGTFSIGGTGLNLPVLLKTDAQGNPLWLRTYGEPGEGWVSSAIETHDGGFIMAGITLLGSGEHDMWLIKTDAQGDSLWSNTFGGESWEEAYSVIETRDGGFMLAGYTSSFGSGYYDMWLVKTDARGDSLWSCTYGGSGNDNANSVIETSDGGFLLTGFTTSFGSGVSDFWLVKTDAQGDSLWSHTYGGSRSDYAISVVETSDGGFLLGGYTSSFGSGYSDMWLVKTNAQGDSLWSRTYGGSGSDYAYSLIETSDGGFLLAGYTSSFGSGYYDMWLMKTNARGDSLWSCTFGGQGGEKAQCVIETSSYNYILAGYTSSFGAGDSDMWLVCVEGPPRPDIEMSAARLNFGAVTIGEQANLPLTVYNVGNGTLVLYGIFSNLTVFYSDWDPADSLVLPGDSLEITVTFAPDDTVIFTDSLIVDNNSGFCHVDLIGQGISPPGIGDASSNTISESFFLRGPYPNPFNATTVLSSELRVTSFVNLGVYDLSGRKVVELVNGWREAGRHEVTFDGSGLAAGVYVYRLVAGEFEASGKMVLMK